MADFNSGDIYARYRPQYPSGLFDFIAGKVKCRDLAWDCATGTGQAAVPLSACFNKVIATDVSAAQIAHATPASNIVYLIENAEDSSLNNNSADLITIAQALHWFNHSRFYKEVKRVIKPGGIVAAWTYSLLSVNPEADTIISQFHFEVLRDYWDPERAHVINGYEQIPFPFKLIAAPLFEIRLLWGLDDIKGYLNTWSAVTKYKKITGTDPVPEVIKMLAATGLFSKPQEVTFPLHLKMGCEG